MGKVCNRGRTASRCIWHRGSSTPISHVANAQIVLLTWIASSCLNNEIEPKQRMSKLHLRIDWYMRCYLSPARFDCHHGSRAQHRSACPGIHHLQLQLAGSTFEQRQVATPNIVITSLHACATIVTPALPSGPAGSRDLACISCDTH